MVATVERHRQSVYEAIDALKFGLSISLNKGSVMVLPSGVDKATGLAAALGELAISPRETIGVGDAENDLVFLERCGFSAAVANALPSIRSRVNMVTSGECGRGVTELIEQVLADELPSSANGPALAPV
jgi:hydroxymethylpyrimidine pyrophosphatase-like HAD family hydrolase